MVSFHEMSYNRNYDVVRSHPQRSHQPPALHRAGEGEYNWELKKLCPAPSFDDDCVN
jgi:hypothetical protein